MHTKYEIIAETIKENIRNYIENNIKKLPAEREIAKNYKVSRQTVRNALYILETEGYIKSIQGSGNILTGKLPGDYRNTIGLILNNDSDYIGPSIVHSLKKAVRAEGLLVRLFVTNGSFRAEREALLALRQDESVLGIISEPVNSTMSTVNFDIYEALHYKNIPVVFFNGYYQNLPQIPFVEADNYGGGYYLAQYLARRNHVNIGGIFQLDNRQGQERFMGMCKGLLDLELTFNDDNVLWYDQNTLKKLTAKDNTTFLVSYIKQCIPKVSAVICQNDFIAYNLVRELKLAGYIVPDDISLISFDNSYLADFSGVGISSLYTDGSNLCTATVELLMAAIRKKDCRSVKLPLKLYDRRSVLRME